MTAAELETVYEAMARKLDAVAPENRELYLAKLGLLLALATGDVERVLTAVGEAAAALD